MGAKDTLKTAKLSLNKQEQSLDIMPSKKTKKAKAKERQMGKKLIRDAGNE